MRRLGASNPFVGVAPWIIFQLVAREMGFMHTAHDVGRVRAGAPRPRSDAGA